MSSQRHMIGNAMQGLVEMEGMPALLRAELLARAIENCLPTSVPAAALPVESKIPFKMLSLREVLFHRASALATPAVALLTAGNLVAGILLARAVMETTAMIAVLSYEMKKFATTRDVNRFDRFVTKSLLANRRNTSGIQDKFAAESVMDFINAVTKKNKGFRTTYDELCEYAHPNYEGTLGSFGNVDREKFILQLGASKINGADVGAEALARSLEILVRSYDDMVPHMTSICQYFDSDWREQP